MPTAGGRTLKGTVDAPTDLLSSSPGKIADRGSDLRRGHEVAGVDIDERVVTVAGPDGEFDRSYGDLFVATGPSPPSPGRR